MEIIDAKLEKENDALENKNGTPEETGAVQGKPGAGFNFWDVTAFWKREYEKEYGGTKKDGIDEGCRKLSWKMIEKMGEVRLSRMQMNAIIQLALHQDEKGITYTNNHIMCSALGCNESYFMDIMHFLEDHKLICMDRSADWRHHKKGVWRVKLVDNSFAGGYKEGNTYVRIGHGFFQSERFFEMSPAAKYMTFHIFYDLGHFKKRDLEGEACVDGYWPAIVGYKQLINETAKWAGYSTDTCRAAFRSVANTWKVKPVTGKRLGNRRDKETEVCLPKEDVVFKDTDGYTYASNIILAVLEEEGVSFSEIMKVQRNPNGLAGLILKYEKKMKGELEKAGEEYRNAEHLMGLKDGDGKLMRETVGKAEECAQPFMEIFKGVTMHAQKAFYNQPDMLFVGKDYKKTDSQVLGAVGTLPLWAKMVVPAIITSCKWLEAIAALKKLDLRNYNVIKILEEFMETLLCGKRRKRGYLFRTVYRNVLNDQAA